MVKVKGKFLNLVGGLMTLYKEQKEKADQAVYAKSGKHFGEFELEEYYDLSLMDIALETYVKASPTGKTALVTMGRNVYPLIDRTVGIPPEKKQTPLDAILFEAEGFLENHKSDEKSEVKPRKIVSAEKGRVVVEASSPDFGPIYLLLFKGAYLGIFQLLGIKTGKVEIIDEKNFIYEITW